MQEDEQTPQVEEQAQTPAPSLIMDNDAPAQEPHPLEETQVEGTVEEPAASEAPAESATPTAQPTQEPQKPQEPLTDPGEFQPNDYSFDVELADGTKIHIAKPEDFANVPQDADFGSPKAFMDVQAKYYQMVNGTETDRKAHEKSQEAYTQQQEQQQQVEQRVTTMLNEFSYLESSGDLPKVPAQYENADWSDPEIAKQPGIKERIELLTFRKEENEKRAKAGLPGVGVLEAKTLMENKAFKEAQTVRTQRQNDVRKQRSGMVSGQSQPAPQSATSNDMIVGSGGSLRDL